MLTFIVGTLFGIFIGVIAGPELKAVYGKLYAAAKGWYESL